MKTTLVGGPKDGFEIDVTVPSAWVFVPHWDGGTDWNGGHHVYMAELTSPGSAPVYRYSHSEPVEHG